MKYKVKIDGRKFEVELEDLFAQPISARVDGEPIEVWLEGSTSIVYQAQLSEEAII